MRWVAVVLLAAATGGAPALRAQDADSLFASGVRAYRALEFDRAAGLLSRAAAFLEASPDTARRAETLVYYGATEIYLRNADSAQALFRRLIRLDPGYRIDRLIFPPEVTVVFDAARRATPAVAVRMAREQRFQTGTGALTGVLRSSTFHEIAVEVQRLDGSPIVRVYAGPIADSLAISWDGRGSDGHPLLSGRYLLAVSSLDSGRVSRRMVRIPMEVTSTIGDTLPLPPLPEAELLPELKRATGGAEALLGGLVAGTLVAVIPSAAAPDASLAGGRWVVGIALVGAGVAGFLKGQGDRVIAENVAANDSIRAAWREQQAAVTVENARRRDSAGVVVRLGAPQVIEREGS